MKIILMLYHYVPSGADTVRILAYIKNLKEMGHVVELVTKCDDGCDIEIPGVIVHRIKISKCGSTKLKRVIDGYRLVKLAKSVAHVGDVVFCYSVPIFGLLFPRKFDVFYEETEVPTQRGDETKYRKMITWFRVKTINKARGLCVISDALKKFYVSRGVGEDQIVVINMFVDTSRFDGLKKEETRSTYIGYCGTLSNHKDGVDLLIKAFNIVHGFYPDAHLKLAGVFSRKEDEIKDIALVESLSLKDFVEFTGVVPMNDLPQFLLDARILVLARPNNRQAIYGFPTKLGEYLLSANPVVVTAVGDIPVFLHDGVNAYIANPGDIVSIANKIIQAIKDEDACRIGAQGRETAIKNFNSKVEAQKLLSFITQRI